MFQFNLFFFFTFIFMVILFISNYIYKFKLKQFKTKYDSHQFSSDNSPLYKIYSVEKKIHKLIYYLYIIGLVLFVAGLFLVLSNMDVSISYMQFGLFLLILSAVINLVVTINYFRIIKKEQLALQIYSSSNNLENKVLFILPAKITFYKKISYVSLFLAQSCLLVSLITESGLV
ncbi:hypothetical protein BFC22_11370 [Carnobacterium divergens]|uniref:hypothetical protein n=1 Tax=Carnobacterium divergens TaxID=2748 RepID=UPI000E721973|nr:hypothetical protein [Carnobacterium divergens]AOA00651.1 hypothetical protein BFC22_11370 [Carnobacterium divergens]